MHIGALRKEAGRDFGLVHIFLPNPQEPVNEHTFSFELDRQRLRRTLRREGRYLLRSNMQAASPETVWESYLLLTRIEQAFKDLKGELSIRPIWRQLETCPRENGAGIVASRSTTAQGLCLWADWSVVPTFLDDPLNLLALRLIYPSNCEGRANIKSLSQGYTLSALWALPRR